MAGELRGGRINELGVGIETEFGEGEEAGLGADEAAEFHEFLGGEALHGGEFAAGELREIVTDEAHGGGGLGDAGVAEEPAVERIGEFVDADGFAGEIAGGGNARWCGAT